MKLPVGRQGCWRYGDTVCLWGVIAPGKRWAGRMPALRPRPSRQDAGATALPQPARCRRYGPAPAGRMPALRPRPSRQDAGATGLAPPQPARCRRYGPAPGRQDAGAAGLALALSRPLARLGVALCGGGYQGKRGMTIAVDGVVVDHANGLHEGVTDS